MKAESILVTRSLQETLWRLEEARLGLRKTSATDAKEALQWVLKRQGLPGSYGGLFAPTQLDISKGIRLPTGESVGIRASARHIIGEEALRTLVVWKYGWRSPPFEQAMDGFKGIFRRVNDGIFCCSKCTVGFLRSAGVLRHSHLAGIAPDEMDGVLMKSLNRFKRARTGDGRWRGFPSTIYYYTLLALADMDMPLAKAELKYAGETAERLIRRNEGDDREARFRRLGLEAALNAA